MRTAEPLDDAAQAIVARAEETSPVGGASTRTGGFDHVEVPARDDKPRRRLDKRQFEALPLQERIGLLLQGTLRFYRGDQEVPPTEAMRTAY